MRSIVMMVAVALVLCAGGCAKKSGSSDGAATGEPFDLGNLDKDVLGGKDETGRQPGDNPLGSYGGKFVEANSSQLDPEISAEAQQVLKDLHFAYNSSSILPNEAAILQQVNAFLKRFPQVVLQVEGHCDERGTEEYNTALGSRRSNAVRQFLADLQTDPNRIFTITYGEERPIDPGHNETAWAKNRRDEFVISK